MSSRRRFLLIALLFLPGVTALAETPEEADLREEILLRCYYEMGEFGAEGMDRCIQAETSAARALATYPESAKQIIARCTRHTWANGWAMVKVCADNDIGAETALAGYLPEHLQAIESCRAEVGRRGAAKVKACVDRRIAGER